MRTSEFLTGLILGGLVGAGIGLLYTPDSGQNVRVQARSFVKNFKSEVKQAAISRRAELEAELDSLRTPKQSGEGTTS